MLFRNCFTIASLSNTRKHVYESAVYDLDVYDRPSYRLPGAAMTLPDVRGAPSAEFIASLRERYRVEPEIDRMLTRKMQRRPGAPYTMVSLELLSQYLNAMLTGRTLQFQQSCELAIESAPTGLPGPRSASTATPVVEGY